MQNLKPPFQREAPDRYDFSNFWGRLLYFITLYTSFGFGWDALFHTSAWLRQRPWFGGSTTEWLYLGNTLEVSVGNRTFQFGRDSIILSFIYLTVTLFPLVFLYIHDKSDVGTWGAYLLFTEVMILLAFITLDLLVFFIAFELLIFPMYRLIVGWGSPGEGRKTAARSFVMYTIFGILLLLVTIVGLYLHVGTTDVVTLTRWSGDVPIALAIPLFIAFCSKVPIFPFYH